MKTCWLTDSVAAPGLTNTANKRPGETDGYCGGISPDPVPVYGKPGRPRPWAYGQNAPITEGVRAEVGRSYHKQKEYEVAFLY